MASATRQGGVGGGARPPATRGREAPGRRGPSRVGRRVHGAGTVLTAVPGVERGYPHAPAPVRAVAGGPGERGGGAQIAAASAAKSPWNVVTDQRPLVHGLRDPVVESESKKKKKNQTHPSPYSLNIGIKSSTLIGLLKIFLALWVRRRV